MNGFRIFAHSCAFLPTFARFFFARFCAFFPHFPQFSKKSPYFVFCIVVFFCICIFVLRILFEAGQVHRIPAGRGSPKRWGLCPPPPPVWECMAPPLWPPLRDTWLGTAALLARLRHRPGAPPPVSHAALARGQFATPPPLARGGGGARLFEPNPIVGCRKFWAGTNNWRLVWTR